MSFLEARRVLAEFKGGESLPFLLAMSGTADPLVLYLRAAAARRGRSAEVRRLPFNTLPQLLFQPAAEEREVFLLTPWDFLPGADWRSGLPSTAGSIQELQAAAESVGERLAARADARLVYLPAPIPPLLPDVTANRSLEFWLRALAAKLGAIELPQSAFALGSYLASGCPVGGAALPLVAEALVGEAVRSRKEPCKVLVTDLDNVLWSGVIAEEGTDGVHWRAEGAGYRHFLYQTLLAKLRQEGVLLAAVSRNDLDVAIAPLRQGKMTLQEADFVAVVASYQAKSAQIRGLAEQLNLGLSDFVFVDDNPVELAEVAQELPAVHCVTFPSRDDDILRLMRDLAEFFARRAITAEDRARTELYRRRLAGMTPSTTKGADLTEFLRGLEMRLTIHDRSSGDRTRAVQLINKTNQFNLNGARLTDEEVQATLSSGGRLFTADLEDRHGSHGEVVACLVDRDGTVRAWVMSCRVFQRRVEHAFLAWLAGQPAPPRRLSFLATPRNTPLQEFLRHPAFRAENGMVEVDAMRFATEHAADLELFAVTDPSPR